VPTDADLLAGVMADLSAAFGGNLNPDLSTPQGQLGTALAAVRSAADALSLQLVNGVDPASATGRMQDALGRIYFMQRIAGAPTTVTATCYGAAGTALPAGSLAQATDGTIYQSLGDTTIGAGGSSQITFAALDTGAIACPAGALVRIYRAIPGWDAITNMAAGVPGRDVESRIDFETRRQGSVAINALGILPAMRAAILAVDGVVDAFVTENSQASALTTSGVTLAPNSLYVAVQGGADADVARAIWRKKPPGCAYNGGTTVTVEDQSSGYVAPFPTYGVTFQRPAALPVFFSVAIASSSVVPADVDTQVRTVIATAFNGEDGGQRVRIGTAVYASRFYAGIAALGPWAQIMSLHVGTASAPTGDRVTVDIDQFPTLDVANVAVSVV
jgi:hypothetical protein